MGQHDDGVRISTTTTSSTFAADMSSSSSKQQSQQSSQKISSSSTTTTDRTVPYRQASSISTASATSTGSSSGCVEDNEAGLMSREDNKDNSELRSELKGRLRSLLLEHNGCTKNEQVQQVIEQLTKVNPCAATTTTDCTTTPYFEGEFHTLTAPTFPGRIKKPQQSQQAEAEDLVQYTLGKLSFNLFQPNKLVCTLKSVKNPVRRIEPCEKDGESQGGDKTTTTTPSTTFTYHLASDIVIHTPSPTKDNDDVNNNGGGHDLSATLMSEAKCWASPTVPNRVMVTFLGGTLLPTVETVSNPTTLQVWKTTFDDAYDKADQQRSYFGWFVSYAIQFVFGLTITLHSIGKNIGGGWWKSSHTDTIVQNSFHFDMKRSPKGHLDVLYLDDELRITKGNRGTICVVERSRDDKDNDDNDNNKTSSLKTIG